MSQNKGRVTIPTNLDVVKETLDIVEEWGADEIRVQRSTLPTIQQEKITHGQRQIRMRSSRCTS